MLAAVDNRTLPGVFLDLDPRATDRFDVVDEMTGEFESVRLDRDQTLFLGVGVGRLFLRVGRQNLRLITGEVRVGEISTQAGGDVDVVNFVTGVSR